VQDKIIVALGRCPVVRVRAGPDPAKIQLVCVGWQPVYSSFDQGAMSHYTGDEKDTIVVKLDKVHGSASLPTQLGTVTAPLSETDQLILFG
jgi:hypothetical protein